jgi:hypothetical protein
MLRMLQAAQHQHQRPFTLVVHASETDQEVMQTVTNLHPACLVVLDAGEARPSLPASTELTRIVAGRDMMQIDIRRPTYFLSGHDLVAKAGRGLNVVRRAP